MRPIRRYAALLLFASTVALAQAPHPAQGGYQPEVGQEGKDVVWVPSPQELVDRMLDLAKVTPKDFLMDRGSGDGRTVITAAKRGAKALGVEYNPKMVELSKQNAQQAGVAGRASFVKADLFETDLSKATVITMFLLPEINLKLRPKLLDLRPGTRIVSNTFTMGDWKADETVTLDARDSCVTWCTAMLWIVPAKVAGHYRTPQGEVTLKQEFQVLTGTLDSGGKTVPLEGQVRGSQIAFTAGGKRYRGSVRGKELQLGG